MWGYPKSLTSIKWPHGTEWQCGNSTLAMSWPNHVQILSFASMASRQGAVKHGFVSKIAGGCSSYDVIAPWPDLTWSFFLPKVAQGLPHKVPQNPAALRTAVFSLSAKILRGVAPPAPVRARDITKNLHRFEHLCCFLVWHECERLTSYLPVFHSGSRRSHAEPRCSWAPRCSTGWCRSGAPRRRGSRVRRGPRWPAAVPTSPPVVSPWRSGFPPAAGVTLTSGRCNCWSPRVVACHSADPTEANCSLVKQGVRFSLHYQGLRPDTSWFKGLKGFEINSSRVVW